MLCRMIIIALLLLGTGNVVNALPAITQTIPPAALKHYADNSQPVKKLISDSLVLAQKQLTYLYGSSDPKNYGMDCSGTIYYLLSSNSKITIPRSANEMYDWVKKSGKLHVVTSKTLQSTDFKDLKPGDLLFWSGTYATQNHITHVMLYLGNNQENQPLMFGSSDGRTYQNKKMRGVSVFDFNLPKSTSEAAFVGYGCIPTITC